MCNYRIIFLDIDGVLNSELWARFCYNRRHKRIHKHNNLLNPNIINKLGKYCKIHNIKLVISSSWRLYPYQDTIDNFKKYSQLSPLIEHIIGITPYAKSRIRGEEIDWFIKILDEFNNNTGKYKEWYGCYKENFIIDKFVIVDDDDDILNKQLKNFVHVNFWNGLCKKDYVKINKILAIN